MSKNNFHIELKNSETLVEGAKLADKSYRLDTSNVFMFSAVTWNRHKIHYDQSQAEQEGHKNVLIQRGLIGNIFTRYINELFSNVFIQQLNWKVVSSAAPDQILDCSGAILNKTSLEDSLTVELSLELSSLDNQKIAQATATIRDISKVDLIRPCSLI